MKNNDNNIHNNILDNYKKDEIEIDSILNDEENEYFLVSTFDGYIHAYSSQDEKKELWKVNLGKELVTTNIMSNSIAYEPNALIPMDGRIYLYSNDGNNKNFEVNILYKYF
jgi:hypothetical protein